MIFDGHSDLLYDVTRRRLAGENCVLERRHRQAQTAVCCTIFRMDCLVSMSSGDVRPAPGSISM